MDETAEAPRSTNEIWARDWEARTAFLFELWQQCEAEGPEHCPPLLGQIRECRSQAESAPVPEVRTLALRLVDEVWDAARRLLYGDLEHARAHGAQARSLDREIRARIRELAQNLAE